MKDKLNRFIDNLNGEFVEVSYRPAEFQCMDLAYEWIFCLDFPKSTIQHGSAFEVYTLASDFTRQYFDVIPNLTETIPQEGDLAIWKPNHIAIVIEATQKIMTVFEQNNPTGTNAHIQDRGYTNCLGFLRPKIATVESIPQWLKTLFQESGLSFTDESLFRVFWEKAIKYDDDLKSLQAQIKSTNEALADRALEVSELTEKNQKLSDGKAEIEELLNKLRTDKNTLDVEKARLELQVNNLSSSVTELQKQVEALMSDKPLLGYSWWERWKSLWGK
jgi:FtsZ-binding cell division protein ZapB